MIHMYVYVTFLSHRAPDGDNKDAEDGENQERQHATNDGVWYCAVSLHHRTRICGKEAANSRVRRESAVQRNIGESSGCCSELKPSEKDSVGWSA